jgi:hypothetical protein
MDLEVQVGGAGRIAAVTHVADDCSGGDPADALVLVAREVGAEVLVAVVAVERNPWPTRAAA